MSNDPTDPEELKSVVNMLKSMDGDEYEQAVLEYSPELHAGQVSEDENLRDAGWPGRVTEEISSLSGGLQSPAVSLKGYLACALTGLNDEQRQLVFMLSNKVAEKCVEADIDLYEPRNITDPVHHADVPDYEVWKTDRERVLQSDLVVHLAAHPSTGSGEELSFAYDAMIPIVVVAHASNRVSRMVTGIPGLIYLVTYDQPEDLNGELERLLAEIRPNLVARRLAFAAHNLNVFGARIKALRESRGLTVRDLVGESPGAEIPSAEAIAMWEDQTDQVSNPSLLHIRVMAALLGVGVADLIDPPSEDSVFAHLERYVDAQAARGAGTNSDNDSHVMKVRVLRRLIDRLEQQSYPD